MNRFSIASAGVLLGLASLWLVWGRSDPQPQPVPIEPERTSRIATRPRAGSWPQSGGVDAGRVEEGQLLASESYDPSERDRRRAALRPKAGAAGPRAVGDQPAAAPPAAGGPRRDTAAEPAAVSEEASAAGTETLSAEDAVAQSLGAVASLPLAQGKTESNGLAPAAAEDVTYDDLGAFFGPLARFVVVPPPDLPSFAGTVSFWVQPAWTGEAESNAAYFQWRTHSFANRIQIFKNGPFLRFLLATDEGVESGVGVNILHWRPDEWHAVTATWGDGVASLYIDGAPAGSREYTGEIVIPPGTPWYIGSDHPDGAPGARSRIRGFQIYPRALSMDEVLQVVGATQPPLR